MKKILSRLLLAAILLFGASFAYAQKLSWDQYADYLAKVVDDVVNSIHATVPGALIDHSDVLMIMCIEQQSLNISKNSSAGAKGLTQVMPGTFNDYARKNIQGFGDFARRHNCTSANIASDVRCSIEAGARIFNKYLMDYRGDRAKAAIAYNAGPGRVNKPYSSLPAETKQYLRKVPACKNPIVKGQSPVANKIWQRLVAKVGELTGGKFALSGAAKLVPYIASNQPFSEFTNPFNLAGSNSGGGFWSKILQGLRGFGSGNSGSSSGTYSRSPSGSGEPYRPYGGRDKNEKDRAYSFSDLFSPENTRENREGDLQGDASGDTFDGNSSSSSVAKKEGEAYKQSKVMLSCAPSRVAKGESFLLTYSCDSDFESVSAQGFAVEQKQRYDIIKISPQKSKTYSLSCKYKERIYSKKCTVNVEDPKILEFYISPSNPKLFENVVVSWSSQDSKDCTLQDSEGLISRGSSGSVNVKIKRLPETLFLRCESNLGAFTSSSINIR